MAKTKTPFFSMGARGSVGRSVTAQNHASGTLLRGKPLPSDPYTLPQAYQRWLYEDYAYLWTQQTNATKAEYRTDGVRHHLTAFQYWMKYQLTNMSDIVGIWHLDHRTGSIQPDFSRKANHATVFGASYEAGLIDGALHLDGLNDYCQVADSSSLHLDTILSVQCFVRFHDLGTIRYILSKALFAPLEITFILNRAADNKIYFYTGAAGAGNAALSIAAQPQDIWLHFLGLHDGTNTRLFIDAVPQVNAPAPLTPVITTQHLFISSYLNTARWLSGDIDHIIIRNRAPNQSEITRWSERRYPT